MHPIVVLGSLTLPDRPGRLLEERLKRALEVARPGQVFIVSGKGESQVMADYLRARTTNPVVEETEATSTNENLENSWRLAQQLAQEHGADLGMSEGKAHRLYVVTSNFHALRTWFWARHLDIPVHIFASDTPADLRPKNYMRELIATPHSVARIFFRKIVASFGDELVALGFPRSYLSPPTRWRGILQLDD